MRGATLIAVLGACVEPPGPTVELHHDGCDGRVTETPILDSPHQPYGSSLSWPMDPPTSGPHWPVWPAWDRAYVDLPRETWLHAAEHGGVVLLARCADCTPFDDLVAIARDRPTDAHCAPPLRHRLIVTSDERLRDGVEVAAIAWGVAYTARCVDSAAIGDFIDAHYGRATENTCAEGIVFDGRPF